MAIGLVGRGTTGRGVAALICGGIGGVVLGGIGAAGNYISRRQNNENHIESILRSPEGQATTWSLRDHLADPVVQAERQRAAELDQHRMTQVTQLQKQRMMVDALTGIATIGVQMYSDSRHDRDSYRRPTYERDAYGRTSTPSSSSYWRERDRQSERDSSRRSSTFSSSSDPYERSSARRDPDTGRRSYSMTSDPDSPFRVSRWDPPEPTGSSPNPKPGAGSVIDGEFTETSRRQAGASRW